MELLLESPTVVRLVGFEHLSDQLAKILAYTNKATEFEARKTQETIRKWKGKTGYYLVQRMGQALFDERLAELEAKHAALKVQSKCVALFRDDRGLWTHSGLAHRIGEIYNVPVTRKYDLPVYGIMPWDTMPEHKLRPYQTIAVQKLLEHAGEGPCAIEYATGAGKSLVICHLLKEISLPALIVAPSISIARQLYDDLSHHFGKRYVGLFGDGKKEFKKKFVVGIAASITKVVPGSDIHAELAKKFVVAFDEAHLCPAATVSKIALMIANEAPYRFFVSATQMRNDGQDLVLEGITGPVVSRKSLRELVDEGYLAKPTFKIVRCDSGSGVESQDANEMTRKHLFYNRNVCKKAGFIATNFVTQMKRPTLILVDEVEQFSYLLPHLAGLRVKFAHGPLTKENKDSVPEAYRADDPSELVDSFNRGEIDVLVGTSCISTGTDIRVAEAVLYLQGGKSEIKIKQGLGRGTRGGALGAVINPWTGVRKVDFVLVDFDVVDGKVVHKHSEVRAGIYEEAYAKPEYIEV